MKTSPSNTWPHVEDNDLRQRETNVSNHIFSVSAGMVGVCLTVIGLIRVVITLGKADTLADNLLAGDALLFLAACFLSYGAMRTRRFSRMKFWERSADTAFILAMTLMAAVCGFITFSMAIPR